MKRRKLIALSAVFVTAIATLLNLLSKRARIGTKRKAQERRKVIARSRTTVLQSIPGRYFAGDLNSEIARVLREVDNIEFEALAQLRALPPPTLTNQPPILAHTDKG